MVKTNNSSKWKKLAAVFGIILALYSLLHAAIWLSIDHQKYLAGHPEMTEIAGNLFATAEVLGGIMLLWICIWRGLMGRSPNSE